MSIIERLLYSVIVGNKFKSLAYAGLFGGVLVGFGGILYTLYTELSETSGSYAIIERAVKRVENDQRVRISVLNWH